MSGPLRVCPTCGEAILDGTRPEAFAFLTDHAAALVAKWDAERIAREQAERERDAALERERRLRAIAGRVRIEPNEWPGSDKAFAMWTLPQFHVTFHPSRDAAIDAAAGITPPSTAPGHDDETPWTGTP